MTPPEIPASLQPGSVIAEKYRIERVLGIGGMGFVLAARHVTLDGRVAIKVLLPSQSKSSQAPARFLREAQAAARIKSEHVARVSDVGTLDDGTPYMVMEYLEGLDLSQWLHQKGPLPIEKACTFILHACEALSEAHALGIIHRDLKPANLFVTRRRNGEEVVKVLDFGISKITQDEAMANLSITETSMTMGSPMYMSPEQMQSSKSVDHRSDIWALGITLYELLTAAAPFDGTTMPEVIASILTKPVPNLQRIRRDVPKPLDNVIARCLQKDRMHRFASVAELAFALAPFAPDGRALADRVSRIHIGAAATGAVTPPEPAPTQAPLTQGSWEMTLPERSPWKLVAGVAAAIGAVVALIFFLMSGSETTSDVASADPADSATSAAATPPVAEPPPQSTLPEATAAPSAEPRPSPVTPVVAAPAPRAVKPVRTAETPVAPRPRTTARPTRAVTKPPAPRTSTPARVSPRKEAPRSVPTSKPAPEPNPFADR